MIFSVWAITRDEIMYPDAENFLPERFEENTTVWDPRQFVFGAALSLWRGIPLNNSNHWQALDEPSDSCPGLPQRVCQSSRAVSVRNHTEVRICFSHAEAICHYRVASQIQDLSGRWAESVHVAALSSAKSSQENHKR